MGSFVISVVLLFMHTSRSIAQDVSLTAVDKEILIDQCGDAGFSSDVILDDCCHFWHCANDGSFHRQSCMPGTVWHPGWCTCVHPNEYQLCDPAECVIDMVTSEPCPDKSVLAQDGKCCINGDIYEMIDSVTYKFGQDRKKSRCPDGQVFSLESCCCEGDIFSMQKCGCYHWPFSTDFIDIIQGVPASSDGGVGITEGGADSELGGTNLGSLSLLDPEGSIKLPRFINSYYGTKLFISVWFKADPETQNNGGSLIRNAGLTGTPTIRLDLLDEIRITGGLWVKDGTYDFLEYIQPTGGWHFIAMSYDEGCLTLVLDDDVYTFDEQAPLDAFNTRQIAEQQQRTMEAILDASDSAISEISELTNGPANVIFNQLGFDINPQINTMLQEIGTVRGNLGLFDQASVNVLELENRLEVGAELDSIDVELTKTDCRTFDRAVDTSSKAIRRSRFQLEREGLRKISELLSTENNFENIMALEQVEVLLKEIIVDIIPRWNHVFDMRATTDNMKNLLKLYEDFDLTRLQSALEPTTFEEMFQAVGDNKKPKNLNIKPTKMPLTVGIDYVGLIDEVSSVILTQYNLACHM
ncbi:unnamed protein product [Owenia fusiformis]|uniref:Uncharacterized protein n=1 Tax=Owenia fusiformis TaxID=6347 RepID=A0A8J1TAH1_OWEFU|nr:unnamed protein product [Owenia fusiformis]